MLHLLQFKQLKGFVIKFCFLKSEKNHQDVADVVNLLSVCIYLIPRRSKRYKMVLREYKMIRLGSSVASTRFVLWPSLVKKFMKKTTTMLRLTRMSVIFP